MDLDWDDILPAALAAMFQSWVESSRALSGLKISRAYFPGLKWKFIAEHAELHAFGDASEKGYGACVYIRIPDGQGYQVSLVTARCRVAPLKLVTLPRLELLASLICARLV